MILPYDYTVIHIKAYYTGTTHISDLVVLRVILLQKILYPFSNTGEYRFSMIVNYKLRSMFTFKLTNANITRSNNYSNYDIAIPINGRTIVDNCR